MGCDRARQTAALVVDSAAVISWFGLAAERLLGYSSNIRFAFILCIAASHGMRTWERLTLRKLQMVGASGALAGFLTVIVIEARQSHPFAPGRTGWELAVLTAFGYILVGMVVTWPRWGRLGKGQALSDLGVIVCPSKRSAPVRR